MTKFNKAKKTSPKQIKVTKQKFVSMIGGWKKFRDFLENHNQLYIPPPNDFSAAFGLALL